MNFTFNETQQEVQALANRILQDISTTECLNKIDQQEERFDKALWAQLSEAGLLGVAFSENNGGMGFGFTELCLFVEEVGRTVAAVPVVSVIVSAALPIQQFGSKEQQARLLPKVARGELLITAGLMESRSQCPVSPQCVAVSAGEAFYLTGAKTCVPFAKQSERILVTAKIGDDVGIFLVDPQDRGCHFSGANFDYT